MVGESSHHSGWRGEDVDHIRLGAQSKTVAPFRFGCSIKDRKVLLRFRLSLPILSVVL